MPRFPGTDVETYLDSSAGAGGRGWRACADHTDLEAPASSLALIRLYPFLRKHACGRNVALKGGGGKHLGDVGFGRGAEAGAVLEKGDEDATQLP